MFDINTHEYFGINPNIVWATIEIDLESFEQTIVNIINDIKPDLKKELIDSFMEDNHYLDFAVDANIYKYMDKDATQRLINEHLSGEQNRRLFIWSLLNFEEWGNIYG